MSEQPINRVGTFLYQLDDGSKGQRLNLWSGRLEANNGYPREHAERAAKLFVASPALYEALKRSLDWLASYPGGGTLGKDGPYEQARAALSLAEGKEQA